MTVALPAVGRTRPRMMRSVVVFPAPFGPEEAGDRALAHLEAQVVDRDGLPEPLGEVLDLDQVSGVT